MSTNETCFKPDSDWPPVVRSRGSRRASEATARKRPGREFVAAWLVCGGIWFAGLGGLALAQDMGLGGTSGAPYYQPNSSYSPVQDITGRYTVVTRSLSAAVGR
jgi:hypothetical protein